MRTRINWTGGQPHITPVELSWSGGRPVYRTGASAWLAGGYAFRRPVKVKNRHIDEDLDAFPLLVQFGGDWRLGRACRSDGYDVAFTEADGKSTLPYEREYFGIASRMAEGYYWVRKDLACRGDNLLYMYYGKGDASDGESPTDVWDANFKGVWHLAESGNPYLDSTSNNNDSTAGTYPDQIDGKVHKGQDFEEGNFEYISFPDSVSLSFTIGGITISGWVKFETIATSQERVFIRKDVQWQLGFQHSVGSHWVRNIVKTDGANDGWTSGNDELVSLSVGAWYYSSFTYNGSSSLQHYWNGLPLGSSKTVDGNIVDNANVVLHASTGTYYLDGILDELRISNIVRSAAWLKFCYYNQFSPHEIEIGEEETPARVIRHG